MESIPVLKGRTESRKPFLDALRQQVSAKLEEDPGYAGILKELKEIEEKEKMLQRLKSIPIDIDSAKQNKDHKKRGELESERKNLEMTRGLLSMNIGEPDKRLDEAENRIGKEKENAFAKQNARKLDLEKSRSAAETLLKSFDTELPYGGVGKVYIVPSGGGSPKPILEIVAP
jgi:chromosome segregation ATPase